MVQGGADLLSDSPCPDKGWGLPVPGAGAAALLLRAGVSGEEGRAGLGAATSLPCPRSGPKGRGGTGLG